MKDFKNKVDSLTDKKATRIPATAQASRGRACSLNIVCAKNNRKSITLHKTIAEKLALGYLELRISQFMKLERFWRALVRIFT